MKKAAFFLAVLLMLVCLCGCTERVKLVGVFVYDQKDTFISELTGKIISGTPDNILMQTFYADRSQILQNKQILNLLDEDPDLLIINPVDRTAAGSVVNKCAQKQIPLIFYNREPLAGDMSEHVYYVGANAENQGSLQAETVRNLFGDFTDTKFDKNGDGTVQTVVLKGEQGHQDAEKRTEYCISQMREYGYGMEILEICNADWEREKAYNAMKEAYGKFAQGIELIFANNDDMALGAVDYLKEINALIDREGEPYDQPIVIVGVDATANGLKAVEDGYLLSTVLNDSTNQAAAILALTERLVSKRSLADFPYNITAGHYVYINGKIILQENVRELLF